MDTSNDTKMRLASFGLATAAGIQASRQSVDGWTARDEQVAHLAAKEALRAWLLLTLSAARAG